MFNGQVISLKTVLWKVMNNPLALELSYDLAAEYALEGIKLIGAPLSLVNRVSDPIKVVNFKAALPIDMVTLKQVRSMVDRDSPEPETIPMTYATDTFHNDLACRSKEESTDYGYGQELTYTAEEGVIKTSFQEGFVQVAYKALPMDKDGFPLIPNNQKVLLGLEYHILYRYLEPLYILGKISDKAFNHINQQKLWYIGASGTSMQLQSYDQIEAVMNTINRLIVNSNAQSNFFKMMGKKERLRRYN